MQSYSKNLKGQLTEEKQIKFFLKTLSQIIGINWNLLDIEKAK